MIENSENSLKTDNNKIRTKMSDINEIIDSFKIDYANGQINNQKNKVEEVINSIEINNDITKNTNDS